MCKFVIRIFNIKNGKLLMESEIKCEFLSEAEQYAENLVEDFHDYENVYFNIS